MIAVELKGGMGNQMFQYALGRHLAIKNQTQLYLDTAFLSDRTFRKDFVYRNYALNIFRIEETFLAKKVSDQYNFLRSDFKKKIGRHLPFNKLRLINQSEFCYQEEVINLSDNVYLNGYWQNVKYFEVIGDIIRKDFLFKNEISSNCLNLLNQIKMSESVCLHVRRTDFVNNANHKTLDNSYYESAEMKLLEKTENLTIFVFSDDMDWCKKNIRIKSKTIFVDHLSGDEMLRNYFELMINCRHFIIPNSSFGWWAAWLSESKNKTVVAPQIWVYRGYLEHEYFYNFKTELMSPEDWIII